MKNIELHKIFWHISHSLLFLSILPISYWLNMEKIGDFSRSAHAFPLAGLVLALPPACLILLFDIFGISPLVNSLLAILTLLFITGALHEDGLADSVDGFFGGKNKQEKLQIMKDSNIGTYGTLALVFSLASRIVLLWQIIAELNIIAAVFTFLAIAALSRTAMIWLWANNEIAENDNENNSKSLAQLFQKPDNESLLMAGIFCLPIIFILLISCGIIALTFATAFAIVSIFTVDKLCRHHIGGIRGDSLGAIQQVCEIALYLGLAAFL